MDGMEDKLGTILGNPELMQQIMSMAQSLGKQEPAAPPPDLPKPPISIGEGELGMIQAMSSLMGKTGIDTNQQALLRALMPYLSTTRINKLENAMRAAKMAGFAAGALRMQGGQFSFGR